VAQQEPFAVRPLVTPRGSLRFRLRPRLCAPLCERQAPVRAPRDPGSAPATDQRDRADARQTPLVLVLVLVLRQWRSGRGADQVHDPRLYGRDGGGRGCRGRSGGEGESGRHVSVRTGRPRSGCHELGARRRRCRGGPLFGPAVVACRFGDLRRTAAGARGGRRARAPRERVLRYVERGDELCVSWRGLGGGRGIGL
jgi:hypothetical protein